MYKQTVYTHRHTIYTHLSSIYTEILASTHTYIQTHSLISAGPLTYLSLCVIMAGVSTWTGIRSPVVDRNWEFNCKLTAEM